MIVSLDNQYEYFVKITHPNVINIFDNYDQTWKQVVNNLDGLLDNYTITHILDLI